jgi:hypothetical protein
LEYELIELTKHKYSQDFEVGGAINYRNVRRTKPNKHASAAPVSQQEKLTLVRQVRSFKLPLGF